MRKILLGLIPSLLVTTSLFAQSASRRPMTVDDSLDMVRIENVLMSPDGRWVFYSTSDLDWDQNKREQKHYIVPADGGDAIPFIGRAGGSAFQFSPDGEYLSFLRSVDGNRQIFRMRMSGGEASKLTNHRGGIISYKWSGDVGEIFFTADEARSEEEQKEHDKGADAFYVREGANGRAEGRWRNLWLFDLSSMKETRLTNEELVVSEFDVSPDGSRVLFAAMRQDLENYFFRSELYLVDAQKRQVVRLTENNAPENRVLWAPDGKTFAYHAPSDGDYDLTHGFLWIQNPDTGEKRKLPGQNHGQIGGLTWTADSKSLLFNESRRTNSNLYRIDTATGAVTDVTSVAGTLRALAFSKDRTKMVYSFSDFETSSDLFVSSVEELEPIRLTNANPWIAEEILLAKAETVRYKSKDGMEIEGVFYHPGDHQDGAKMPLILHIHGGPPGHYANRFRPSFHIFAGLGYASLGANIRGSDSYGDALPDRSHGRCRRR